jgi:GNAT superfamily N-acetyltransferase
MLTNVLKLRMIQFIRMDSKNGDFIELVKNLDADLAERDGEEHAFYGPLNTINTIKHALVAYEGGRPVGCGAIREFSPGVAEVKRMYTSEGHRGKGIATGVLPELEKWAADLSCKKCVLETGKRQPEAIGLYKKNGYRIIPNYGQYAGVENSVCFEKKIG